MDDIDGLLKKITTTKEPQVAFPQADKFERVINLCEILSTQSYTREQVTREYAFDVRQTNYYTDAAQYLGLVRKEKVGGPYNLTEEGRKILNLPHKKRQLASCEKILQHKAFGETLKGSLEQGSLLGKDAVVTIMKNSNLYNIESESTFERRSSTIRGWVNWILSLLLK